MKTTLLLALALSAPNPDQEPTPLTYTQAVKLSRQQNKPLVVWVGGEFCEACVRDSATEYVHVFVNKFEGATAPATVVGVWEGNDLLRIADMDWWIASDATFGHVPSIRRAIRHFLTTRLHFRQSKSPAMVGYSGSSMMRSGWQSSGYMMQAAPVRMRTGG